MVRDTIISEMEKIVIELIKQVFKSKPQQINFVGNVDEEALRAGLKAKRDKAVAYLGTKWILHPDNHVRNKSKVK
jgi:hypothetical protein